MKNNNLNIYWSPAFLHKPGETDWNILYNKPYTLFNEMSKIKSEDPNSSSFLSCPAFSEKTKNILVFTSPIDMSYKYNQDDVFPISNTSINIQKIENRKNSLSIGPTFMLSLHYVFFSEESVSAYFTPPFFHKPQYTSYCVPVIGEFDIGQWFRPYNLEIQTWSSEGEIHIKKDEPLFYIEIKTDKKINLQRFNYTEKLWSISNAASESGLILGRGLGLKNRYKKFKDTGLKDIVLDEINKNIVPTNNPFMDI
jgi:hypothetical protein